MAEPTAAERAADVLLAEPNCGLDPWEVVPVLDALLRHPDVLVDLAIEAGGLEKSWMIPRPRQVYEGGEIVTLDPMAAAPEGSVQHYVRREPTDD